MVQLSILRISASAEKQVALRGKNSLYLSTDGRCTCTVSAATFSSLFALVRVVLAGSALEKARWLAIWSPIERSIEVSLCVSRGGVQCSSSLVMARETLISEHICRIYTTTK